MTFVRGWSNPLNHPQGLYTMELGPFLDFQILMRCYHISMHQDLTRPIRLSSVRSYPILEVQIFFDKLLSCDRFLKRLWGDFTWAFRGYVEGFEQFRNLTYVRKNLK